MKQLSLLVLVLAMAVSVAGAQDIESMMAGRAQIGAGQLSEAWLQNPAFLGLGAWNDGADSFWNHSIVAAVEIDGDTDLRALSWGGNPAGKPYGVGAGMVDVEGMDAFGAGIGWGSSTGRIAAGLNFQSIDTGNSDDLSVLDFAVSGRASSALGLDGAIWGIVVRDITDEMTTTLDLGLGFEAAQWKFALDLEDVSDEVDTILQVGASRFFGREDNWQAGVGLDDGDLTAGLVYHASTSDAKLDWKIGLAYIDGGDGEDDALVLGGGTTWGP